MRASLRLPVSIDVMTNTSAGDWESLGSGTPSIAKPSLQPVASSK